MGRGGIRASQNGGAATAVPGADSAGHDLSGCGGAGAASDAIGRTQRALLPDGGYDGSGAAGGGPAAHGGPGVPDPGGDHHGGGRGDEQRRLLQGAEAGHDRGATGAAATRGIADCGGDETGPDAGG